MDSGFKVENGTKTQELYFKLETGQWAEDALGKNEDMYRLLVENANDAIFVVQDDAIRFANPSTEAIFKYSRQQLGRIPVTDIVHPQEREKFIRNNQSPLPAGNRPHTFSYRMLDSRGEDLWINLNVVPIEWEGCAATLNLARNLTRQKRLEAQLVQAAKMEALGTLVAGVAHEINNPINLIMYNTPLLEKIWSDFHPILKNHATREPQQRYGGLTYDFLSQNLPQLLGDMDMAANRIVKIVSDLKRFAKQSYVTEKTSIQVNTAVENAIRLAHTTLRQAGVRIQLELAPDLPEMTANLQNIEQIILNIVINAVQSIEHDHGEVTIGTASQPCDDQIRVTVTDNGRGIDPNLADRLFDPFVTSKQTNGGTGLGLSVSYSLVKAHDGSIDFKSQPGKGTTFTVTFPSTRVERKMKILVVDDEQWMRHMLKKALSKNRPYVLDESANGVEALIRLGASRPDLLILDLFMPKMDGLEVCRAIQTDPNLEDMKVIITTGFPDHPKLTEVARLGFGNIHYKPFNLRHFVQAVDRILDEKY